MTVQAVLIGGPWDGRELDVPDPPPLGLTVAYLPVPGAGETRWDDLLPPPLGLDTGDPLSIPVPELLKYIRRPDIPPGLVRYWFVR